MNQSHPLLTLLLTLVTTCQSALWAQDSSPVTTRPPACVLGSFGKVKPATFLAAARAAGVITSAADLLAVRKLQAGLAREQRPPVPDAWLPGGQGNGPLAITAEQENNDHIGLADLVGPGTTTVTGTITDGDVDTFQIHLTAATALRLVTSGNGANPIGDTVLILTDSCGGVIDSNDDVGFSLYSQLDARLPAGDYFAKVQAGFGASHNAGYQLTVTTTAAVLPALTSGQPINAAFASTLQRHTYVLALASDAAVALTTTGPASGDLVMSVHRATMGPVHQVDDSTGGGTYPLINTRLPAGLWYVVVMPYPFSTPGAYTLTARVTPQAIPAAPCNGSANGNTAGPESHDVYRLTTTALTRVRLSTAGGTLFDTVLDVFDQSLARVTYNDDANTAYSLIDTVLPAGVFYVVVHPGPGSQGTYTLTATCVASGPLPVLANGRTTATISGLGNTAAFSYVTGTETPTGFRVDQAASTLLSGILTVLDSSGQVVAFDDGTLTANGDALCGNRLAPGTYTVLVRDRFASPGTAALVVQPMLFLDPRGASATLRSVDKSGRVQVLFASTGTGPGIPVGGSITGNLLLNPALLLFVAAGTTGADGSYAWPLPIAGFTGAVQAVSLNPLTLAGAMTNAEQ